MLTPCIRAGYPHLRSMKTLQAPTQTTAILAQLLERLDASRVPVDAHQYRTVAERLAQTLANAEVDWSPLLAQSPAATEIYENLHYAEAGLCRSSLEAATAAEMVAREAIKHASRRDEPDTAAGV